MWNARTVTVWLALCLLIQPAVHSQTVLFWADKNQGSDDALLLGLRKTGYSYEKAYSYVNFRERLVASSWDLAIIDVHNLWESITRQEILARVSDGGRVILTDWSPSGDIPSAFGFTVQTERNQPNLFAADSRIWQGVNSPITLFDAGWTTFSRSIAPAQGSTVLATYDNGDAAIVMANDGRTIFNSFLDDTFDDSTREARIQLAANEIKLVLDPPAPVPERSTAAGMAALLAMGGFSVVRLLRGQRA